MSAIVKPTTGVENSQSFVSLMKKYLPLSLDPSAEAHYPDHGEVDIVKEILLIKEQQRFLRPCEMRYFDGLAYFTCFNDHISRVMEPSSSKKSVQTQK